MIEMGDFSYGRIKLIGKGKIKVGKYCSIAEGVQAVMVGHDPYAISTYPFNSKYFAKSWLEAQKIPGHPVEYGEIEIGNDVWIGQNALLVGKCKISDGAIIGAGSVVRGYIKPYSIVIGNPARVVSKRFLPENIGWLLFIKWWDWPKEKIQKYSPLLCQNKIDEFISIVRKEEGYENTKGVQGNGV